MAGAKKGTERLKEHVKQIVRHPFQLRKNVEDTGETLQAIFEPDTTNADAIAQETLDLMKAEAAKPAVPIADEYELRRARRRRGGVRGMAGRQGTILTDRLGG
jgi:hypothetical protein